MRVDLLTPSHGARDGKPVLIRQLNAAAQPLELLDYLLESPIPAPLVNGGASLVYVPDPARFALHKLMVSGRRQVFEQTKAGKDRQQAAEIIDVLFEDRRGDLTAAVKALNAKPATWRVRLKKELSKLPDKQKDARAYILRSLK